MVKRNFLVHLIIHMFFFTLHSFKSVDKARWIYEEEQKKRYTCIKNKYSYILKDLRKAFSIISLGNN